MSAVYTITEDELVELERMLDDTYDKSQTQFLKWRAVLRGVRQNRGLKPTPSPPPPDNSPSIPDAKCECGHWASAHDQWPKSRCRNCDCRHFWDPRCEVPLDKDVDNAAAVNDFDGAGGVG